MAGISSFAGSLMDAVASGIRSRFRRGCGFRFRSTIRRDRRRSFRCGQSLGCWRIENPAGQRIQRRLDGRQDLRLHFGFDGVDLGFDLRLEIAGGTLEFAHEAADLASDLRQLPRSKDEERQDEQKHHLAEAEFHIRIIMRDRRDRLVRLPAGQFCYNKRPQDQILGPFSLEFLGSLCCEVVNIG